MEADAAIPDAPLSEPPLAADAGVLRSAPLNEESPALETDDLEEDVQAEVVEDPGADDAVMSSPGSEDALLDSGKVPLGEPRAQAVPLLFGGVPWSWPALQVCSTVGGASARSRGLS